MKMKGLNTLTIRYILRKSFRKLKSIIKNVNGIKIVFSNEIKSLILDSIKKNGIKRFPLQIISKFSVQTEKRIIKSKSPAGEIIFRNNKKITIYRGNKYIDVKRNENRIIYNDYNEWKLVQSRKGKAKTFEKLWENTKYKQIRNWTFGGIFKNDRVLEVGFRDGYNLRYLQQKGVNIEGIEVNHDAVIGARNLGCKAFEEDIQMKTHYKDKTFNVISACDVLEHCFSPENALKEMYRILKDNGRIILEIPLENDFKMNLLHGHSFLFQNVKTFKSLVKSIGFYIYKKDVNDFRKSLFLLKKLVNQKKLLV